MGKEKKDDVTPQQRLEDERLINRLRRNEEVKEKVRKDAQKRDENG